VPELNALRDELAADAAFALIYIQEAHARDEWPLGLAVSLDQTRTTAARVEAASACLVDTGLSWPTWVDLAPENVFEEQYHPWPIRFFILRRCIGGRCDVTVDYIAEPTEDGYDLEEVRTKLLASIAKGTKARDEATTSSDSYATEA
jgi:Iodothyronine deiodinase